MTRIQVHPVLSFVVNYSLFFESVFSAVPLSYHGSANVDRLTSRQRGNLKRQRPGN